MSKLFIFRNVRHLQIWSPYDSHSHSAPVRHGGDALGCFVKDRLWAILNINSANFRTILFKQIELVIVRSDRDAVHGERLCSWFFGKDELQRASHHG